MKKNKDTIIEKNKSVCKVNYLKEYTKNNKDKINEKRRENYQKIKDSEEWKAKTKMNYKKAYAKIKENKIMKIFDSLNVDENVKTELLKKLMLF